VNKVTFSVNNYDNDGDVLDRGIFLHFGPDVRIKVARDVKEFQGFIDNLQEMKTEIEENYLVRGILP